MVAVPLRWMSFVAEPPASSYNVKNLFERLGRVTNP